MARTLEGLTALVSGASQSIGYASAEALARDGATVVITGRGEKALTAARDRLRASVPGARIEMNTGDACNEDDVKAALEFAHAIDGRLDILVPTVGGGVFEPLLMRTVESVRRELEVNFISTFLMIRHGAPLLGHGGSIVCISTVAVTQPFFGLGLYGAGKAGMERMVRAAAFELASAGIRVNAVRPGMTVPREVLDDPVQAENFAGYAAETPLGRVGIPEDIAAAVRFLSGPESGWVTGQAFSCDGGQNQGKIPDTTDLAFGQDVMNSIRAGKPVDRSDDFAGFVSTSLAPPKG